MNPVRDDTATTVDRSSTTLAKTATTERDNTATTPACPVCRAPFERSGRQRYCSTVCRQSAWRSKRAAPVEPVMARSEVVYACPACDVRYLGEQRCDACNTWCRRLGPGAPCPCCDEPISISDLVDPEQLAQTVPAKTKRRR